MERTHNYTDRKGLLVSYQLNAILIEKKSAITFLEIIWIKRIILYVFSDF